MNELLAAIPFSLLLVVSTGPVFFVIIETSITKGARRAFCVDIGAVIADIVFILIASFGANSIRQGLEEDPKWFCLEVRYCFLLAWFRLSAQTEIKKTSFLLPSNLKREPIFFISERGSCLT